MSAEDDQAFLADCLVRTSDLERITDSANPKCIALGRTGAGKSAILQQIENTSVRSARIDPEALSLNYISNSNVISFFESLNINLDIFYQLLWRHIFAVELLKLKRQMQNEAAARSWIENLRQSFENNDRKKRALNYLTEFGDKFWLDTEERVREVVRNIENHFEREVGISVDAFKAKIHADAKDGNSQSIKETSDIVNRATRVVNDVQVQELNGIIELLSEDVFHDRQQKYIIIIDDLDTGWVHESIRFKLVRSLIETLKKFKRISNVKIVIGLRVDLLETVLQNTASAGFQTEKFEDMMLRLSWAREELMELANKRIAHSFKDQYTSTIPQFYDIFASKVGTQDSFDYILDRSLHRPRDIISFMNECLDQAVGQSKINQNNIRNGEKEYSRKRLRSLADEWRETFGDLESVIGCLRHVPVRFELSDLTDGAIETLCLELLAGDGVSNSGTFVKACSLVADTNQSYASIRRALIETLYLIGAIGVKLSRGTPYNWSYKNSPILRYDSLTEESSFAIHPMLFRELNKRADPTTLV
ncbi:DNA repair ATPase [Sphingomonas sp. TF3]|nr:DNA repair ATPase [Sphingomonas sp. TF3]